MTNVLVMGDATAVKTAIKEYGAECVWWYTGFERRREATSMGISADHIIAVQTATPSEAKNAMDFDKVITPKGESETKSKGKSKVKPTSKAVPKGDKEDEASPSNE